MTVHVVGSFPKIRKTFLAACVQFSEKSNRATKWLAIMRNCISDRRQYAFYRMLSLWAASRDSSAFVVYERDWWQSQLKWQFEDNGISSTSIADLVEYVDSNLVCPEKQGKVLPTAAREACLTLDAYCDEADFYWTLGEQVKVSSGYDDAVALAVQAYAGSLPPV